MGTEGGRHARKTKTQTPDMNPMGSSHGALFCHLDIFSKRLVIGGIMSPMESSHEALSCCSPLGLVVPQGWVVLEPGNGREGSALCRRPQRKTG